MRGWPLVAVLGHLVGLVWAEGMVVADELADVTVIGHAVAARGAEVPIGGSAVEVLTRGRALIATICKQGRAERE